MVAGASTIHLGLLVIAADDGIMPQTLEHLHILDSKYNFIDFIKVNAP